MSPLKTGNRYPLLAVFFDSFTLLLTQTNILCHIMHKEQQDGQNWKAIRLYGILKLIWVSFTLRHFRGKRQETPYMTADNFARVIDILRNETPVYGNATTGSVTTQGELVGEEES